MKKNYLLLFLLALIGWSSGAWAIDEGVYQYKNTGNQRGSMAYYSGKTQYPVLADVTLQGYTGPEYTVSSANNPDVNLNWYVVPSVISDGYFYIFSVANGKFIAPMTKGSKSQIQFSETPCQWRIVKRQIGNVNVEYDVMTTPDWGANNNCGLSFACGTKFTDETQLKYQDNGITNKEDGGLMNVLTQMNVELTEAERQNVATAKAAIAAVDNIRIQKRAEAEASQSLFGTSFGQKYGTDGTTTYSTYEDYVGAIERATDEQLAQFAILYVMPDPAKKYVVRRKEISGNGSNGYYLSVSNDGTKMVGFSQLADASVLRFDNVDAKNATFNIKTINDTYVQALGGNESAINVSTEPSTYTLVYNSDDQHYSFKSTNAKFIHYNNNTSGSGAISYDNTAGSRWTIAIAPINEYTLHIAKPEGYEGELTATISGKTYLDGEKVETVMTLSSANVTPTVLDRYTSQVEVADNVITVTYTEKPWYISTPGQPVYVRIKNVYRTESIATIGVAKYASMEGTAVKCRTLESVGEAGIPGLVWELVDANGGVYLRNLDTNLFFKGIGQAAAETGTLYHIGENQTTLNGKTYTGFYIATGTKTETTQANGAWTFDGETLSHQNTGWAGSVFEFENVSIEAVNEIYANKLLAVYNESRDLRGSADTQKPFTPISANFKAAVTALQNDKSNAEKQQALKNLLADPDNYYTLPDGRYFVHNYFHYDKTGTEAGNQNNMTKNESTLTSLNALLGTAGKVAGYWSVWDISRGENGYYTMVNEGNHFIMKPGSVEGDYNPETNYTNAGKLYYRSNPGNTTKYQVGDPQATDVSELKFTPAVSLYNQSFNGVSLQERKGYVTISGSYNTSGKQNCVMFMDAAENGKAHAKLNGDHYEPNNGGDNIVKSGTLDNVMEECLWSFYRLDTDEGNEQEVQLFHDATEGSLVGIVGGVITLNNVDGITCLADIKKKINDYRIGMASNDIPKENPGERAAKYKEIIDDIETMRANPETKQFYQFLTPGKDFFVENMCASRPSLYSRLSTYDKAGDASTATEHHGWQAKDKELVNEGTLEGVFNSVIVAGTGDGGYGTKFYLHNKEDQPKYLTTTSTSAFVGRTENLENAAQFTLTMVIPGIYQMKQINSNYFTVSGSGEHFGLKGFNQAEISAMFRFVTYNTVHAEANTPYSNTDFTSPAAEAGGAAAVIKPVFTTFSYPIATKIQKNKLIAPYYITQVGQASYWMIPNDDDHIRYASQEKAQLQCGEGVTPVECNRVYIDMVKAPLINDYYYMEGNQGYLLVGSDCQHTTGTGKKVTGIDSEDIEMVAGNSWPTAEYKTAIGQSTINGTNLFSPNTSADILINSNNQQRYFALQYTYDKIGSWNHQDVMGEGLGFYHLQVGRKIGKFKAYLDVRRVKDGTVDWKAYNPNGAGAKDDFDYKGGSSSAVKAFVESGDGFGIRILDQDGNVTRIVEVDGKGQAVQNTIYDLQGRRVEKAGKGVYIVGGKKVLFQ